MLKTCFVIQPFDGGPFDKRYEDVFVPAIETAGLGPYRVDRDPAVVIPIEEIEKGIRKADACLADISLPNPNVWYELGFALALGKPVVLVCSHDPARRFPFDIQHRTVITYRTESTRDFDVLRKDIAERLKAALKKENTLEKLAESNVAEVGGLSSIEISALATVAANLDGHDGEVSSWTARQDMERAGYSPVAVTIGLTSLQAKGFLTSDRRLDRDSEMILWYQVTATGLQWLTANQNRLVLHREKTEPPYDL